MLLEGHEHCFCQTVWVEKHISELGSDSTLHEVCCMCGQRRIKSQWLQK